MLDYWETLTQNKVIASPFGLYNELYRPQFHFTARENWLNDPNGLVYYDGEYHLFFQHNPNGNEWGKMSWGHAVSTDLVHWKQIENALEPDRMGAVFSGSAVVDWRNTAGFEVGDEPAMVAIYTAAGDAGPESAGLPYAQCLAFSNDRGRTWEKYSENPVVPHIIGWNRDPKVTWYEPGGYWVMVLYLDEDTFAILRSKDLKCWKRTQTLSIPGARECPDLYEIAVEGTPGETRWILAGANGLYYIGTFNGKLFEAEEGPYAMTQGENFYGIQTFSDIPVLDGRRIQIAWMAGGMYPGMPFNQQMSFPCELRLHRVPEGLRLFINPIREIDTLYSATHEYRDIVLTPWNNPLPDYPGSLYDVLAEFEYDPDSVLTFNIHGHEVRYACRTKMLSCGHTVEVEPVDGKVRLRMLVDRTSIEIFANDGRVLLNYCMVPSEYGVHVSSGSSTVRINLLSIHELRSSWTQSSANQLDERLEGSPNNPVK